MALGTFTRLACYRYNSRSQAPVMEFQDRQFDAVFWRQSPDLLLSTVLQVAVVLRRTCCYPRSSLDPETSSAFYAQNPVSVRVECFLPVRVVDLTEEVAVSLWNVGKELLSGEKCAGRTCVADERVTEDSTCTTHFDEGGVETRLLR